MAPKTVQSPKIDGIDKWEVENAADALIRANEVKANPKLLKAAHKVLISKAAAATKAATTSGLKQSSGRKTSTPKTRLGFMTGR
ncbi:MAG: hypothetical protein PHH26_00730 [Candidatus Thermoplasmatota archaeon]|nr:hypothetical protein [Candidatus Thermoplasmatota archaeon]